MTKIQKKGKNNMIEPSLLSSNLMNVGQDLRIIEKCGIERLHIDVMDGKFVPNLAFSPNFTAQLNKKTNLFLDCHLMTYRPEKWVDCFDEAGANLITVHVESTPHIYKVIQQVKDLHKKVGIALNPGTSLSSIKWLLSLVDQVLIMTVNPGFGGQNFITEMVNKILALKQLRQESGTDFQIEVDGGITSETIKPCMQAGADVFVAGSFIFNNTKIEEKIKQLQQIDNLKEE
ncbi:ribulose-5-phosphate 3-epimerase [Liquorilactobacillus mali KCTC 3596 = DSM 20444]|uniref:Ribulose-phosphate 3-epimerase n=2 Tax=Liquorilactobacillus mali TaxID=1618 RepID=A0A0R2E0U1_9LACO|nr:ribulose-5-phosphate 3-epimerase [Liquorilactobacillus mali KCTC 3596 = DSM 20444]